MPSITVGSQFEADVASGKKKAHIILRRKRECDSVHAMDALTIYVSRKKRQLVKVLDAVCTSTRFIFRIAPGLWAYDDDPARENYRMELSRQDLDRLAGELGFGTADAMDDHFTRTFRTKLIESLLLVRWR